MHPEGDDLYADAGGEDPAIRAHGTGQQMRSGRGSPSSTGPHSARTTTADAPIFVTEGYHMDAETSPTRVSRIGVERRAGTSIGCRRRYRRRRNIEEDRHRSAPHPCRRSGRRLPESPTHVVRASWPGSPRCDRSQTCVGRAERGPTTNREFRIRSTPTRASLNVFHGISGLARPEDADDRRRRSASCPRLQRTDSGRAAPMPFWDHHTLPGEVSRRVDRRNAMAGPRGGGSRGDSRPSRDRDRGARPPPK